MFTKAYAALSALVQRKLRLLFIILFLLGIVAGAGIATQVRSSLYVWIYSAGCSGVSFLGLAVVLLLPLLVSFSAFYFDAPILVLPIVFLKASVFSFCSCCVLFAYGDAGWLVRLLMLFSDSVMLGVLCWYWLQHLDCKRFELKQNTILCLLVAVMIGITDYMYISPFTAMLLQR